MSKESGRRATRCLFRPTILSSSPHHSFAPPLHSVHSTRPPLRLSDCALLTRSRSLAPLALLSSADGAPGSGKSYTIDGGDGFPGILPYICHDLFPILQDGSGMRDDVSISVSVMGVTRDAARDLITGDVLSGRGINGGTVTPAEHPVATRDELMRVVHAAKAGLLDLEEDSDDDGDDDDDDDDDDDEDEDEGGEGASSAPPAAAAAEGKKVGEAGEAAKKEGPHMLVTLRLRQTLPSGARLDSSLLLAQLTAPSSALWELTVALNSKNGMSGAHDHSLITRCLKKTLGGDSYTMVLATLSTGAEK